MSLDLTHTSKLDCWEQDIPDLIECYHHNLQRNHFDQAMECMEQASALALSMCSRELRQLGVSHTTEELAEELCCRIQPHQNRSSLKTRHTELAAQFQSVLTKVSAPGIRGRTDKCVLAESWLELAASFAKIPVKYEADILKQQQKQEQTISQSQQEMG